MDFPTSTVALFSGWPVEWPIFGLIAALLSLESFSSGSTRTSSISIAFPLTFIIFQWLPNTFLLSTIMLQLTTPAALSAVFGIIFIGMYFVIHRLLFAFGSGGGDVPQSLISGFATTVILIVFWIQTPGLKELWSFNSQVQLVFNESVRVWWLAGAFAALAYTRG
jgi:hypothetical protein